MNQGTFSCCVSVPTTLENCKTKQDGVGILQDALQRADEEKAVMADKAKAEAQDLEATITTLRADLAKQEQVVEAQWSDLLAASKLKSQVSELAKQLQEQQKMFAAREEQVTKVNAAKEQQLQEAVSQSSSLTQVQSAVHLTVKAVFYCTGDVIHGMLHCLHMRQAMWAHPDEPPAASRVTLLHKCKQEMSE